MLKKWKKRYKEEEEEEREEGERLTQGYLEKKPPSLSLSTQYFSLYDTESLPTVEIHFLFSFFAFIAFLFQSW